MPADYNKKWKVFFLVATSIFMSTLDSSIVNVALPFIMQHLQTDMVTIQWVVIVYLMTVSSLLLSFGRLSDIRGKKQVYVLGFTVFTIGSCACAFAATPFILICARGMQGIGASMLMACSPALVVDAFPPQERGKALGLIGAVVAAGLTTGPVLGGLILEYLSWRSIFYINIPIGIMAVVMGLKILNTDHFSKGTKEPLDKAGSLLLIMVISSLVVLMTQLSKWGVFSIRSVVLAVIFIIAAAGFVFNEMKTRYPLFDLALLKIRLFIFPVVSAGVMFAGLFIIVFMMPFYLTYPCGFAASKTGTIMIVPFLFLLFVSPVSGMLYNRFASRKLCLAGMGLMGLSQFSLIYIQPEMGVISILWRIGLSGLGTALFVSPNNTAIMSSVSLSRRGIASGAVATARNLGMVIGVSMAGLVFSSSFLGFTKGVTLENYVKDMEPWFMISFSRTMMMGAILSVFGMMVTFFRGPENLNLLESKMNQGDE